MALEDLRDGVSERAKAIWGRVRETDAYLRLSERYESLSPIGQKGAIAAVVFVAFLLIMAVPWSFYSSSQTSLDDFEGKRNTIRELFKVNRETAALPPAPAPVAAGDLANQARQTLTGARLAPEQIVAVSESPGTVGGIAKSIEQTAVQVSLSKLNLKQIIDIGNDLQNIQGAGTARMIGLEVKANVLDSHYYDAVYKIVSFAAKPEIVDPKAKGRKK